MLDLYIAVALWCANPKPHSVAQIDSCRSELIACIAKGAKIDNAILANGQKPVSIDGCFAHQNLVKK